MMMMMAERITLLIKGKGETLRQGGTEKQGSERVVSAVRDATVDVRFSFRVLSLREGKKGRI